MAEGQSEVEKDLENEITCSICHEHYTDPKVLPCCHYYCKECIGKLSQKAGSGGPFPCPECRKDTTLPEGVDSLPTAFFVNRMKAVHSKLVQAPPKQVSEKCEMCFKDKPEAFCQQCDKYVCEDCIKPHRTMKALQDHNVKMLDKESKSASPNEEPSFPTCEKHAEKLQLYCFDCNCLICVSCTDTTEHKAHCHEQLREASTNAKKKLTEQMQPLKTIGANLSRAVKDVQATTREIETQGDVVIESIKSSFDEMYKILRNREQALLTDATIKVIKKLKCLSVQEKKLSSSNVTVQAVLGFTEQCLKHFDDGNFMCLHAEIQSRLEKTLKEEEGEEKCLAPVEVADIEVEVNCIEKVKELCNEAKVLQHALNCTVSGKGLESAEVNNVAKFKVKLMRSAAPALLSPKVECHLKSLKTGSVKKCEVSQVIDGERCVQYVPTVQGRHELTLTVNGQPVSGSPFPVFVSINPTQMERVIKTINCNTAGGIAIDNSADEIIVAAGSSVVVLDWNGKQLSVSNTTEYGFGGQYYGVAIDSTNEYIYATCGSTRLVKFSRDLKLTNTFVYPGSSFQGLTVVGNEIMVCDCNTSVKVYNEELKYVRSIGTTVGSDLLSPDRFLGVSSDGHANIYTGDGKCSIKVFSNDGTFLRSFKTNLTSSVWGVFVTPQYVYALGRKDIQSGYRTNTNVTMSVCVSTHRGDHVATIGNFPSACGICVDKDGYLYVRESNKGIHIF